ncbi:MAG: filamentous hemagglutinin N-terminal domain-containing protein [Cyanobacteria bacterium J06643_5]
MNAQVVEDGTLPTRVQTTDNLNFNIDSINNQNRVGGNLFHSFKEFSIPTGGSAIFNNSTDVVNIINRVTGGNISNIDGLIKASGNANLFLINPAGIVFGKNARLDIGGSFFGSTAESIKFTDNIEFSAIDITTKPLLTINVPLGLQMGSNSAPIKVEGTGYTSIPGSNSNFSPFIVTSSDGLRVKSGNTLALIGGELSLNGGQVTTDSGRIELGGVKEGFVNINSASKGFVLDYNNVQNFGDIKFDSKALANASGSGSGSIRLQGQNISIKDSSRVFIQSQGLESGEKLQVNAIESIEVVGTNSGNSLGSAFLTETIGVGDAAKIAISTPNLLISQDGAVITRSLNLGAAGDINISTNQLSISSGGIFSNSLSFGSGGDIYVSTDKLTATNGGTISSVTFGLGSGGNIDVNAKSISLTGYNPNTFIPSSLSAGTIGIGEAAAGSLTVNTGSLVVKDGGRVDSSTFASGAAGSITINAKDFVEVSGTVPGTVNPSLIISSANIVDEFLQQALGLPPIPSGNSGNVDINTPVLRVNNGGEVTVRNDGTGKGGILNINANSILVNNKGKITASTQSGEGGNIDLQIKNGLILRNQGLISAEAGGTGNGGNININSPVIVGVENSDIIANALQGNGGNIDINTQGLFGLNFRDNLTAESDITASSQFGVNGTVEINNPSIDPSSSLVELPSDVVDSSQQVASGCSINQGNSFTVVGKGGVATNPSDSVAEISLWNDLRDISIQDSKKINIQAQDNSSKQIIEATGWIVDKQGNIEFVAESNSIDIKDNWNQASNCWGEIVN